MRLSFVFMGVFMFLSAYHLDVKAQWTAIGSPEITWQEPGIQLSWVNGALYAQFDTVLYQSTDNGNTWKKFFSLTQWPEAGAYVTEWKMIGADSILFIIVETYDFILFHPAYAHIVRSTDRGLSWCDTTSFRGAPTSEWQSISGRIYFAHPDSMNSIVHYSSDAGASWDSAQSKGLPGRSAEMGHFASKGSLLFFSFYDHALATSLFKSTDFGTNWTPVNTGSSAAIVNLLVVSDDLFIYMVDYGGRNPKAAVSTDDGLTWSYGQYQPPGFEAGELEHARSHNGVLFCHTPASNAPLWISEDVGKSWTPWSEGLPAAEQGMVRTMAFSDSFAFVGGKVGGSVGFWRRTLPASITAIDVQSRADIPSRTVLQQNYPNPFNPSTTITFELHKSSHANLTVYDLLGCRAAVLVNEMRDPGVHEVTFNGSGLASGVYLYRLVAGDFVQTKTLMLVK